MGGLGPGIGGLEYLVIGIVALVVVGPERLPGMLRQLGKWVAKARGMANEFRSSFDEMARQSELDELRKEVEALRTGQGAMGQGMVRLGEEANAAFKDIQTDLEKPAFVERAPRAVAEAAVADAAPEFPDPGVTAAAIPQSVPEAEPVAKPASRRAAKPKTAAKAKAAATKPAPKPATRAKAAAAAAPKATAEAAPATPRPRAPRKTKTAS